METFKHVSIGFIIGIFSSTLLFHYVCSFSKGRGTETVRVDTVIKTVPVPEKSVITRYVVEPIDIPEMGDVPPPIDVIRLDTTGQNVIISITKKEYKTDDYRAIVEGYKPELSFIETYNKTTTKNVKIKPRWGIGLQVGYGTDFKTVTPYVGFGLQFNLLTF